MIKNNFIILHIIINTVLNIIINNSMAMDYSDITPQEQIFLELLNQQLPQVNEEFINNQDEQVINCNNNLNNTLNRSQNYQKQRNNRLTRTLQCNYEGCNKSFKRKYNLEQHMRIHSEKKPFECNYENCNKTFNRKTALKHHIELLHSDEKSYKCDYCNTTFKLKNTLLKHIKTKHENIRYNCSECDKSYTTKSNLNIHIKKFHNKQ